MTLQYRAFEMDYQPAEGNSAAICKDYGHGSGAR
jgi:hypothetical protein